MYGSLRHRDLWPYLACADDIWLRSTRIGPRTGHDAHHTLVPGCLCIKAGSSPPLMLLCCASGYFNVAALTSSAIVTWVLARSGVRH